MTTTEDLRSYTSSYINNARRKEKFPASLVSNSHSAVVLSPVAFVDTRLSSLVFGVRTSRGKRRLCKPALELLNHLVVPHYVQAL